MTCDMCQGAEIEGGCIHHWKKECDEARADLSRLQETDPHRIARLLEQTLTEERQESHDRRLEYAEAIGVVEKQRDEARAVARDLLYDPYGDTPEEREWHYENQHEWLKEQTDIDE